MPRPNSAWRVQAMQAFAGLARFGTVDLHSCVRCRQRFKAWGRVGIAMPLHRSPGSLDTCPRVALAVAVFAIWSLSRALDSCRTSLTPILIRVAGGEDLVSSVGERDHLRPSTPFPPFDAEWCVLSVARRPAPGRATSACEGLLSPNNRVRDIALSQCDSTVVRSEAGPGQDQPCPPRAMSSLTAVSTKTTGVTYSCRAGARRGLHHPPSRTTPPPQAMLARGRQGSSSDGANDGAAAMSIPAVVPNGVQQLTAHPTSADAARIRSAGYMLHPPSTM